MSSGSRDADEQGEGKDNEDKRDTDEADVAGNRPAKPAGRGRGAFSHFLRLHEVRDRASTSLVAVGCACTEGARAQSDVACRVGSRPALNALILLFASRGSSLGNATSSATPLTWSG